VKAHYDKRTFGNTDRISELLKGAGVPINEVAKCYPSLSELMSKRHDIAHAGDLKPTDKPGERDAEPIDPNKVKEWAETIIEFTSLVAAHKLKTGI
jgi:hypothetical protein